MLKKRYAIHKRTLALIYFNSNNIPYLIFLANFAVAKRTHCRIVTHSKGHTRHFSPYGDYITSAILSAAPPHHRQTGGRK